MSGEEVTELKADLAGLRNEIHAELQRVNQKLTILCERQTKVESHEKLLHGEDGRSGIVVSVDRLEGMGKHIKAIWTALLAAVGTAAAAWFQKGE